MVDRVIENIELTKQHKNLTGQKFGKLTALYPIGYNHSRNLIWRCQCECGNFHDVVNTDLTRGRSTRCKECSGKKSDTKFGNANIMNKLRILHGHIIEKCVIRKREFNEKYYKNITVDENWLSFENFKNDVLQGYTEHIEKYGLKNTSLDRIDNTKGYSKENCRWATLTEQVENRRNQREFKITYSNGMSIISKNQRRFARENNIPIANIHYAIKNGQYVCNDYVIDLIK